ncbi:hypothetical protein SCLCIDRAFT_1146029 [Scleroderma citrinum Foug A]|uniref:Uncharacterized protein n=1 Tax=Scleroderma citrinum Foug A TaxID=1036808 RepID=A0A0C3EFX7_9AGAM|nr:hypothetical protein SCLCIDRAFT_1146029 [Scleroderma citrinum Foug A]
MIFSLFPATSVADRMVAIVPCFRSYKPGEMLTKRLTYRSGRKAFVHVGYQPISTARLSTMSPLTFYDMPFNVEGDYWAPSTAKVRFVLSYKGIPLEIDWVELLHIAPRMKEIDHAPRLHREVYAIPTLGLWSPTPLP